jgi:hypothetical protein
VTWNTLHVRRHGNGDATALAALFTEDAAPVDEQQDRFTGREAVELGCCFEQRFEEPRFNQDRRICPSPLARLVAARGAANLRRP